MQVELLEQMSCPYCGGSFRVRRAVASDESGLQYGLVECRCFVFPVVDGILLLSLAKGYGGAEEALQPYVPLLVAAVRHLGRDDIAGLRAWMTRFMPLAAELIDGTEQPYLRFASRVASELSREERAFLVEYGKYEVLGYPAPRWRRVAGKVRAALRRRLSSPPPPELPTAQDYYAARYFSPRVNALALQFGALPPARRILSLCCGHGVFENLLRARSRPAGVVSVDGQFLNLLITRQFVGRGGNYVCHDVQFPLPFRDGAFDGVFSSTCLPEIPAQRTFAMEAIRVTSDRGWTNFDSIWNTESGVARIDPHRHYRFCQNFFATLDDYVPMFAACAGPDRRVGVDVPDTPGAYLSGPRWAFGADVQAALADRADREISVMVLGRDFPGFVEPDHTWLRASVVAVSFAFLASRQADRIELQRRPEFETLPPVFASERFIGYPPSATIELSRVDDPDYLTALFTAAQVSVVPSAFSSDPNRLLSVAGTRPAPREPAARETTG